MGEKRIVIQAHPISDSDISIIESIYSSEIERMSSSDVDVMLDEIQAAIVKRRSYEEDWKMFYPPSGINRYTIQLNDYLSLATGEFVNDIIIDFFLKSIEYENLTREQQKKTLFLSSFFYNALVKDTDPNMKTDDTRLADAMRAHKRVQKWTKDVNIFEKDFIIIPINKNDHWFLAIVCFPSINGPVTMKYDELVDLMSTEKNDDKKVVKERDNSDLEPIRQ